MNLYYVQSVVKIFSEFPQLDHFSQILMRCAYQSNVYASGFIASQTLEASLLKYPQEFRLQADTKVSDLIEKQSSTIRGFHPATPAHLRARERPLFMAK